MTFISQDNPEYIFPLVVVATTFNCNYKFHVSLLQACANSTLKSWILVIMDLRVVFLRASTIWHPYVCLTYPEMISMELFLHLSSPIWSHSSTFLFLIIISRAQSILVHSSTTPDSRFSNFLAITSIWRLRLKIQHGQFLYFNWKSSGYPTSLSIGQAGLYPAFFWVNMIWEWSTLATTIWQEMSQPGY